MASVHPTRKMVKTICVQRHVGVMRHTISVTDIVSPSHPIKVMYCAAFYDPESPEQHLGRHVTYCSCGSTRVIWGDERD